MTNMVKKAKFTNSNEVLSISRLVLLSSLLNDIEEEYFHLSKSWTH